MARPTKEGLTYFPFDIDFFEDEKIEAISVEFGIKGEIVAIRLLCAVYRQGYFALWTEMLRIKLAKSIPGVTPELIEQIVNRLVRWGFFDKNLFDSVRVLTSVGIQRRYFKAAKRRKSKDESLPYLLVATADSEPLTKVNVDNNPVNVGINVDNNSINVDNNPQRKEKESKVNILVDTPNRVREQNGEFFAEFFSPCANIEPILMQLHRENPETRTVEDFKELARLVICEWEQSKREHLDYTDWAEHLLSAVRIKNRALVRPTNPTRPNATTTTGRRADADIAKQQRDESFARHIADKLSRAGLSAEIP